MTWDKIQEGAYKDTSWLFGTTIGCGCCSEYISIKKGERDKAKAFIEEHVAELKEEKEYQVHE